LSNEKVETRPSNSLYNKLIKVVLPTPLPPVIPTINRTIQHQLIFSENTKNERKQTIHPKFIHGPTSSYFQPNTLFSPKKPNKQKPNWSLPLLILNDSRTKSTPIRIKSAKLRFF
jgi:hypothetical protein